ncbi:hypothetical protein [Streptomyces sp. NPDC048252]|uniref:hypothetical protein n=1 Tax=Streptomyces sp. NPDC048252 TaxID=3154612 RepID=UPI003438440F
MGLSRPSRRASAVASAREALPVLRSRCSTWLCAVVVRDLVFPDDHSTADLGAALARIPEQLE